MSACPALNRTRDQGRAKPGTKSHPGTLPPFLGSALSGPTRSKEEENMKIKAIGIAAGILAASASAFAQSTTVIATPPEKVVTFVQKAPAPTERVVVKEKVVVGQPLPETVVVTPIPDDPTYAYAIVNDERVIVEPSTRKVIQVVK
ncbi:hypothetical protein AMC81_CH01573 [Rhizobium phaseoli]|uniref:DUF1236 domain-containing protein n=2 Tax=Rhizobium phaseoli TaxID=396 RepID=A0ABM6C848_9HYPH|nr:hypothetical protein AMC81_CH01573 [Rhizobium phaseoli]